MPKIFGSITSCILMFIATSLMGQESMWRVASGAANKWIAAVDVYNASPDTTYAMSLTSFLRSVNRGENWDSVSPSLDAGAIRTYPTDSRIIFASVAGITIPPGDDIYRSTDGGLTWGWPLLRGSTHGTKVIEFDPVDLGTVYVGVGPTQLYRSSNKGQTWDTLPSLPNWFTSLSIAQPDNQILYAGCVTGVFKSMDRGTSWFELNLGFVPWTSVYVAADPRNANIVYAAIWGNGTAGGMYKTTDGGMVWNEINAGIGLQDRQIQVLKINPKEPDEILLGVYGSSHIVFRTTNGGFSWSPFDDGIIIPGSVNSIAYDTLNGRIYAGVSSGVYTRQSVNSTPLTESIASHFELFQNYPNPFNSTTTINFSIPRAADVSLMVSDILGRDIVSLSNQRVMRGFHSLILNATNLPSGLYFYTLRTGDSWATKRMILLK